MKIRFIRVLGIRARSPVVLAAANDYLVHWQPRDGWTCNCSPDTYPDCPHIPAVESLLDPKVTHTTNQ
ncbi:hypothetical protein [Mycobacterium syngnathidarum]|uniref:SWIM-type domain-containing protein n=1 Tax=Mycobacterium syngnathidarum TaxID=1908205 RepID=A0A1Q9WFD7_9MYCO|nr:hypothetical protein [Mycobacterium syngnathidarum]OHT93184.1 hypothetical protein BKG61_22480 [Mycobacterium syngnathidarum]OLT97402.1 hypothetical protein BKG60_07270 [Mycobacterium syngnathidarum]